MCVFYYQKCDGIWVKVSLCAIRIKRICLTSNLDSDKWIFDFYYFPQSHSLYSPFLSLCNLQTLTFYKSVYNWLPKKKQLKIKLIIITENSSWYSFLWKYYQSGPPHHQKSSLFPDQEGFVPVPKHSELVWDFVFWCQLLDKHRRVLQFLVCSIQT